MITELSPEEVGIIFEQLPGEMSEKADDYLERIKAFDGFTGEAKVIAERLRKAEEPPEPPAKAVERVAAPRGTRDERLRGMIGQDAPEPKADEPFRAQVPHPDDPPKYSDMPKSKGVPNMHGVIYDHTTDDCGHLSLWKNGCCTVQANIGCPFLGGNQEKCEFYESREAMKKERAGTDRRKRRFGVRADA